MKEKAKREQSRARGAETNRCLGKGVREFQNCRKEICRGRFQAPSDLMAINYGPIYLMAGSTMDPWTQVTYSEIH